MHPLYGILYLKLFVFYINYSAKNMLPSLLQSNIPRLVEKNINFLPLVRQSEAKASLACPEDVMGDGLVFALEVLLKTDGGGDGREVCKLSERSSRNWFIGHTGEHKHRNIGQNAATNRTTNSWEMHEGRESTLAKGAKGVRRGGGILANKENPWIWPLDGKKESLEKVWRKP
jgi:hypothetical protein